MQTFSLLLQISESDLKLWWDDFMAEFFHENATLAIEVDLGDGMRKFCELIQSEAAIMGKKCPSFSVISKTSHSDFILHCTGSEISASVHNIILAFLLMPATTHSLASAVTQSYMRGYNRTP